MTMASGITHVCANMVSTLFCYSVFRSVSCTHNTLFFADVPDLPSSSSSSSSASEHEECTGD
jgi:hypothetical protein